MPRRISLRRTLEQHPSCARGQGRLEELIDVIGRFMSPVQRTKELHRLPRQGAHRPTNWIHRVKDDCRRFREDAFEATELRTRVRMTKCDPPCLRRIIQARMRLLEEREERVVALDRQDLPTQGCQHCGITTEAGSRIHHGAAAATERLSESVWPTAHRPQLRLHPEPGSLSLTTEFKTRAALSEDQPCWNV